jgi:response regulator RpfG family c-di-GMP phosphodiesterase
MGLPEGNVAHLHRGVLLHDIGKLSIPDIILCKDGPLTEEQWEMVRCHPTNSFDLLQPIAFLRPALNIPYAQHERWDGKGYPRGLKAREIPLEARIFSVVNVWTMLQCDRPFRPAWDRERATAYLREQAGIEFDPEIVEAFIQLLPELQSLQVELNAAIPGP